MFKKSDQAFREQTIDPVFRAAALIKLTQSRNWFLCIGGLMSLIIFAGELLGAPPNSAVILAAAIQWIVFFKMDSDLRLLRVIDLLQKDGKPLPLP